MLSDEYGITRQQNTDKLFDSVDFHPTPSALDQQISEKGSFSEESIPRTIQRKLSLSREDGTKIVVSPSTSLKDSTQSMALHVLNASSTTVNAASTAANGDASSTPSSGSTTSNQRFFHRPGTNPANQSTITSSVANVEAIGGPSPMRTIWMCEKCNVEASEAEPFCQQCGVKVSPTTVASPISHVADSIGTIRTRVSSDHLEKLAFIESMTSSTAQPLNITPYSTPNLTVSPNHDNLASGNAGTMTAPTTEASTTGPQASQLDDILGDLMDICGRLDEKLDLTKSSEAIGAVTAHPNAANSQPVAEGADDNDPETREKLTLTRRSNSARILSAQPRIKSANSPLGSPSGPNTVSHTSAATPTTNSNNADSATSNSPPLPKRSTSLAPDASAPIIPARSTSLGQPATNAHSQVNNTMTDANANAPPLPSRTTSLAPTNEPPTNATEATTASEMSLLPPTEPFQSDSAAVSTPGEETAASQSVSPESRKPSSSVLSMSLKFLPLTLSGVSTETPLTLSSPEPIPLVFSTPRETVVAKFSASESEAKDKEQSVEKGTATVRSPFKIISAANLSTSLSHANSQSNSPAQVRRDSDVNTTTACSTKDFGQSGSSVPSSPYLAKATSGKTLTPNATPIKDSTSSLASTGTASMASTATNANQAKEGNAGGSHWINLHKCHKFTNILLDIQRYQTICYNFETPVEKIFFVHKYVTELKPILTEDDFLRFTKLCET